MADREKIIKGLECCSESSGYGCNHCPYGDECRKITLTGCAHLCQDALELLKEQPEQKHGHWISVIKGNGHYTCSCCGTGRYMNFVPDYCSSCGARMDEEVTQDADD